TTSRATNCGSLGEPTTLLMTSRATNCKSPGKLTALPYIRSADDIVIKRRRSTTEVGCVSIRRVRNTRRALKHFQTARQFPENSHGLKNGEALAIQIFEVAGRFIQPALLSD